MYLLEIYLVLSQLKFLRKLEIKMKLLITHDPILLVHRKSILLILKILLRLGNLAENIYNGNVSLDAAKQERTEKNGKYA